MAEPASTMTGPVSTVPGPVEATIRLDDLAAGTSRRVEGVVTVVRADDESQVPAALAALRAHTAAGGVAVGWLGYEAARGMVPHPSDTHWRHHDDRLPLVWFALLDELPAAGPVTWPSIAEAGYGVGEQWTASLDGHTFPAAVDDIRRRIERGDFYQCNLTTQFSTRFTGDPRGAYRDLVLAMRPAYAMFVVTDDFAVCSASPELMVRLDGDVLTCEPMKGTAPASADVDEDAATVAVLQASEKDRAENVMIVDLLRNDLSQVCTTGSVRVTSLLRAERYPTVWQLVSTIEGRRRPGLDVWQLLDALAPCGSITGAPKLASMLAIDELETAPRGVYCGAMGWVSERSSVLNVAIRTAQVDRAAGTITYGAGGGITWSSDPQAEWQEVLAKSRILDALAPMDVALVDTAPCRVVDAQVVVADAPAHRERLLEGAQQLGLELDGAQVDRAWRSARPATGAGAVRLAVTPSGIETSTRAVPVLERVRLGIAARQVASADPWRRVKTTHRGVLDQARAARPDVDDVVFVNERGQVTETSIFTLAVRVDGQWLTPPVHDGCLPGVLRARLLADGTLVEGSLTVDDLARADELAVLNSVRGWLPAELSPMFEAVAGLSRGPSPGSP